MNSLTIIPCQSLLVSTMQRLADCVLVFHKLHRSFHQYLILLLLADWTLLLYIYPTLTADEMLMSSANCFIIMLFLFEGIWMCAYRPQTTGENAE